MTQPTQENLSVSAASEQPMPTRDPRSVEVTPQVIRDFEAQTYSGADIEVYLGVIKDLEERSQLGIQTYGTPLYTYNGRNAALDAYQEVLDACKYYKQFLLESNITQSLPYWRLIDVAIDLKKYLMPSMSGRL